MKLTTPMHITAADSDSRTISGRIVAFNEHANASTGKVVFARGSIQPQDVFLNLEHDNTRRIGKSIAMTVNDKEMTATFKIATQQPALMHSQRQWKAYGMDFQLSWPWTITKCKKMAP